MLKSIIAKAFGYKNGLVFPLRKELLISLFYLKYVLHLIRYSISPDKAKIEQDIKRWLEEKNIKGDIPNIRAFVFLLAYSQPFRNVFYIRLNRRTKLLNIIAPKYGGFHFLKSTQLDGGLFLYHPFNTIINAKSIGHNCTMRNGITVGNVGEDNSKLPVILDNVNFGAGCIVIGDITIGNNSVIGAGAVVTKSIPDNSVVVGNPARVIKENNII